MGKERRPQTSRQKSLESLMYFTDALSSGAELVGAASARTQDSLLHERSRYMEPSTKERESKRPDDIRFCSDALSFSFIMCC